MFLRSVFSKPEKTKIYVKRLFAEMVSIGIGSLPIVILISIFQGAVTTLQTAYQLITPMIAKSTIGIIVSDSTLLELAPTILSLVLAGKIGSHIASEIGTMRINEEIDALEVMGINSAAFLVLPKILAGLIMVPILVIISIFLTEAGGIAAGHFSGVVSASEFIQGARSTFKLFTLQFSLIKAFTFGFIITSISSFHGYFTQGGAIEVGESSTKAVVYSSIMILVADYVLAQILLV